MAIIRIQIQENENLNQSTAVNRERKVCENYLGSKIYKAVLISNNTNAGYDHNNTYCLLRVYYRSYFICKAFIFTFNLGSRHF